VFVNEISKCLHWKEIEYAATTGANQKCGILCFFTMNMETVIAQANYRTLGQGFSSFSPSPRGLCGWPCF
jgi:hypothetical protein